MSSRQKLPSMPLTGDCRVKFGMGEDESAVSAFKPGFRMAIGDPFARAFAGTPAADAVKFLCHEGEGEPVHGFPSAPCPGGIRMRLIFPSCSNGELDSADHKSHMAYPSEIESGDCPEGFKIRTPTLLYESVWKTEEFDNMWSGNGNPFVLSNGDPTGYGLHGDFVSISSQGIA